MVTKQAEVSFENHFVLKLYTHESLLFAHKVLVMANVDGCDGVLMM